MHPLHEIPAVGSHSDHGDGEDAEILTLDVCLEHVEQLRDGRLERGGAEVEVRDGGVQPTMLVLEVVDLVDVLTLRAKSGEDAVLLA